MCYIFFYLLTINCNLIKRQDEKERERRGKEGEREKERESFDPYSLPKWHKNWDWTKLKARIQ